MGTTLVRYQSRRNTAAQWTTANEILLAGEPGYESDTGRLKLGNGTTAWNSLRYADAPVGVDPTAKDFGAKGDGTTDDTAALQAFVTYVVTNGLAGVIPAGTYKISSRLNVPARPGWSIRGAHRYSTKIVQATNNTPIFWLGSDTASLMHTIDISNLTFDYTNSQPATNTLAVPIYFNVMVFESSFRNLIFSRGAYAMELAASTDCPWGCTFDDLIFSSGVTRGAMNWNLGTSATPNNHFGRFYCDCANMVGPVFDVRGYNFVIDTIECIAGTLGPQILRLAPGTEVTIGAIKMENATYTAGKILIEHLGGGSGWLKIDQINFGGDQNVTLNIPAGQFLYLVGVAGGAWAEIGHVLAGSMTNSNPTGTYLFSAASKMRVKHLARSGGWLVQNQSSTQHADNIAIEQWTNGWVSDNKGDANYTVTVGDPNTVIFNTPLTAPRTVSLPVDVGNQINGLWYEIITNGAVNGTNTITVKTNGGSGAVTLGTLTTDKSSIRVMFRRYGQSNPNLCWVATRIDTVP